LLSIELGALFPWLLHHSHPRLLLLLLHWTQSVGKLLLLGLTAHHAITGLLRLLLHTRIS
jgi:hypothetical protein